MTYIIYFAKKPVPYKLKMTDLIPTCLSGRYPFGVNW